MSRMRHAPSPLWTAAPPPPYRKVENETLLVWTTVEWGAVAWTPIGWGSVV